jgi:hypothetical protein
MAVNYYKTYSDAAAEAQRQQRLAEMLQRQADEPMQQYSYQGIQAMPSYAAGLASILSAYGAKKASDKAAEASRQAQERIDQAGTGIAGRLMGGFTPDASLVKKTDMGYEATPQQVPEQASLEEVTRTSQYKQSPEDALRVAMTPAGGAAVQRNPLLAQMLAQQAGPKTPEEFYAPTETADGLVQFGKRGGRRETGFQPATKTETTPNAVREYQFAKSQGYKGSFEDWQLSQRRAGATTLNMGAPVAGVDEQGNPVFFQPSKTGGTPSIVPGVRPSPKGMTQEQGKIAGFADRVQASNAVLSSPPADLMTAKFADVLPGGNFMLNAPQQQFLQAERDFINAMLRRESGAAIAPSEFESARKQYIPQPGDRPETLEQKRLARERAFSGLTRELGPIYKPANQPSVSATGGWGKAQRVD